MDILNQGWPSSFNRRATYFVKDSHDGHKYILAAIMQVIYIYTQREREKEARRSAVGGGTALKVGRSQVRFPMASLEFFIDIILPTALCLWGRLRI